MNRLICGDVIDVLKTLPEKSIQTCVTSPPYYGLRDYGTATWEGGDAECEHNPQQADGGDRADRTLPLGRGGLYRETCGKCGAKRIDNQIGLEATPEAYVETMVNVFREVRRVLKDDGTLWLNLGDSYWGGKGQSSQAWSTEHQERDTLQKSQHQITGKGETRPTDGKHPVIKPKDLIGIPWMVAFALRADGWYLRSEIIWHKPNPMPESVRDRPTKSHEMIYLLAKSARYYYDADAVKEPSVDSESYTGRRKRNAGQMDGVDAKNYKFHGSVKDGVLRSGQTYEKRNRRDVWTVTTKPHKEAHFATFPPDLITPCILAGSKEGDTVLDPFVGSGTTLLVAAKYNRNGIGIDLNKNYIDMADKRLAA